MEEYLTVKDVASLLRVSERTVIRWIRAGYIHPSKIGHTLRFKRTQLLWEVEQLQMKTPDRHDPTLG